MIAMKKRRGSSPTEGLKALLLAAAVACNMAELGEVSREQERLTARPSTIEAIGTASTSPMLSYALTLTENVSAIRAQADGLRKQADAIERRQKTDTRWRELVRACFPAEKKK